MTMDHFRHTGRGREEGVILFVALIFLLVVGLMSTAGLQAAGASTSLSQSARAKSQALEAGETALRFCEADLNSATPAVPVWSSADPVRWDDIRFWSGAMKASYTVPAWALNGSPSGRQYDLMPECLIQRVVIADPNGGPPASAVLVTARGFSSGAEVDNFGALKKGAQSWVQSTLY